jgi:hypothetical protein
MTASSSNVALIKSCIARLRQAGLKVVEVSGWQDRGRPYTFSPRGLVQHHDASSPSSGNNGYLGGVVKGRPDLNGPLSNFFVSRDGTWFIVAAGYCNHAGVGGPLHGIPQNSGNKYLLGCEVANSGNEPYSVRLAASLDRGYACIMLVLNNSNINSGDHFFVSSHHVGHKEWAPHRKTDPSLDMDAQRRRIVDQQQVLVRPAPKPKPTPKTPKKPPVVVQQPVHYNLKALQRAVHVGADGKWGHGTDKALQCVRAHPKSRSEQFYVGTTVDGKWGANSQRAYVRCVKAIQEALGFTGNDVDGVWGRNTDTRFRQARTKYYMKF